MDAVDQWEARGSRIRIDEDDVWILDVPADGEVSDGPPLLVLHGFPSCSFDWRHVLVPLRRNRRVVLFDFPGFGLSSKRDRAYSLFGQADVAAAVARHAGLEEVCLVTHDMGDSIGGELLARSLAGALTFDVSERVLTNGSIYLEMAHLSQGQKLLQSLPDEMLPDDTAASPDAFKAGLGATFSPASPATAEELEAQAELCRRGGGNRLLPRLIRYIGERRVYEERWTGAIERHPSPLSVVWGDADPIAVWAMAEHLGGVRRDFRVHRLHGTGHYPMIESPDAWVDAAFDKRPVRAR